MPRVLKVTLFVCFSLIFGVPLITQWALTGSFLSGLLFSIELLGIVLIGIVVILVLIFIGMYLFKE